MLLGIMSDRAIPRSDRRMQRGGAHSFRFVNAEETPMAGTHSLTWDQAVKTPGAAPDFRRWDLWESIEAGDFPEYPIGVQIFGEAEAERSSFDVLDPPRLVPAEPVPVTPIGMHVLDPNPDDFFAHAGPAACCTAHVVPDIDFSKDPLLAGRVHSCVDTPISRLGGPNFHGIPVNASVPQICNNQRDGVHRQAISQGIGADEPDSPAGGCAFQAGGMRGSTMFPGRVEGDKVCGKPEKFVEHRTQAKLFCESQSEVE